MMSSLHYCRIALCAALLVVCATEKCVALPRWILNKSTGKLEISKAEFQLRKSVKAGDYTFEVLTKEEPTEELDWHYFRIKRGTKIIYDCNHIYVEICITTRDETSVAGYKPSLDEQTEGESWDFDRDGIEEVVVVTNSGGAGCCNDFYVFKVKPSFGELGHLRSEGYGEVGDVDDDGEPEITLRDMPFYVFQGASSADAPILDVPLHFRDKKFVADVAAMKAAEPPAEEWGKWKQWATDGIKTSAEKEIDPGFWIPIVKLWYRGQPTLARKFLDENWPQDRQGKEAFWQEMLKELKTSHYWEALKELNGL